jgi:hypothetical protein
VTKKRQDYRKANVEVKNQDPAEGEKKSKTATSHLCTQIRSDFCMMCFWDTKTVRPMKML